MRTKDKKQPSVVRTMPELGLAVLNQHDLIVLAAKNKESNETFAKCKQQLSPVDFAVGTFETNLEKLQQKRKPVAYFNAGNLLVEAAARLKYSLKSKSVVVVLLYDNVRDYKKDLRYALNVERLCKSLEMDLLVAIVNDSQGGRTIHKPAASQDVADFRTFLQNGVTSVLALPTSGKTHLAGQLRKRGFYVIDTDDMWYELPGVKGLDQYGVNLLFSGVIIKALQEAYDLSKGKPAIILTNLWNRDATLMMMALNAPFDFAFNRASWRDVKELNVKRRGPKFSEETYKDWVSTAAEHYSRVAEVVITLDKNMYVSDYIDEIIAKAYDKRSTI